VAATLSIFCGKGGVGKTTLGLAWGLLLARNAHRVLVVTSHPLAELALSISLAGLVEREPLAGANLFIVHIDSKQVLDRVVKEQIPSQLLAEKVVTSRIYRSLIDIAPGLKELAFLSRLREVGERRAGQAEYDQIVWDAPASGHFTETLRVAGKFETYLTGPFASRGRELARYFSEADMRLFPVTTLEEMAVDETLELCGQLGGELDLRPRRLICNLVSPLLSASGDRLQDCQQQLAAASGSTACSDFIRDRHSIERGHFDRLRASIPAECHLIERVRRPTSDLELLSCIAEQFETMLPAVHES